MNIGKNMRKKYAWNGEKIGLKDEKEVGETGMDVNETLLSYRNQGLGRGLSSLLGEN